MADRICTRFIDDDGLDVGCHLVSKEYVLEAYPNLVPWMKTPALWAWGGFSSVGETGDNSIIKRSSPVQTISGGTNWKSISAGILSTAAIKTDGTLWIWGDSYNIGNNSNLLRSSPVQTVSGGTNWQQVSTSRRHTAAIKTDGTLWTWGYGSHGLLADNSLVGKSSPVQTISGGTNWKEVNIKWDHAAAIKTDSTLWLWGKNTYGELGNNNAISRSSPVQTITAGTNWKQVSAGQYSSAAIKTDGTLWTWGWGQFGQLGNNNNISQSSPVQTITAGTNWKQVSGGAQIKAAIKTDGTLWSWGRSTYGLLGDNTSINRSSPVQTVSGGTNWKEASNFRTQSSAIKTDGTLWMWGSSYRGELGTNNVIARSSPVQTVSGGTNWRSISTAYHTVAIRDEGEF